MKTILIANSFYYPDVIGGAEISTQLLAEALSSSYVVHVLAPGNHRWGMKTTNNNRVHIHRIPCTNVYWPGLKKKRNHFSKLLWHAINMYNPIQNRALSVLIKRIQPDLIHSQNLLGVGTSLWEIANKLRIPTVHTIRDYSLITPTNHHDINRLIAIMNRKRSDKVNCAVGISDYILKEHQKKGFFSTSPHYVIHNVVTSEQFPKRIRKQGEPLMIGCYGQLETNKGMDILIQAVSGLSPSVVKKLIICGTGSQEKKLRQAAINHKRIEFRGKVTSKEVQEIMASTDLTVVPSIWEEPFGRVIIESYRQGTPVIASNVGGIPEVIYDKSYLFHPHEIADLQKKMIEIHSYSNETIMEEINKSYEASTKYLQNITCYLEVYSKVIRGFK